MGTSYHEALPIYRAAMDTTARLDGVVRQVPRFHRHTLGTRLRDTSIEVVLLVARSNRKTGRAAALPLLCGHIEDLKLLLNLGKEAKAFGAPSHPAMETLQLLLPGPEAWFGRKP